MHAMMRSLHGCRAFSTRDGHKSVRVATLPKRNPRGPIYTSAKESPDSCFDVLSKERDRKITRCFAESPAGGTTRYNPVASELNLPGAASQLCYVTADRISGCVLDGERSRGAFICRTFRGCRRNEEQMLERRARHRNRISPGDIRAFDSRISFLPLSLLPRKVFSLVA